MPARIIAANNCAYPRGYIIEIMPIDQRTGETGSLREWVEAGLSFEDWERKFSSVIVTDKNVEELQYLKEPYVLFTGESDGRKYSFSEPDPESELWQTLYLEGEVYAPFETVNQYIVSR